MTSKAECCKVGAVTSAEDEVDMFSGVGFSFVSEFAPPSFFTDVEFLQLMAAIGLHLSGAVEQGCC